MLTYGNAPQQLADVAVVMPTVLRPTLLRAVRSVYTQRQVGRIHLLIGIDQRQGDADQLDRLLAERPAHVAVTLLDLGYSTSNRHGGYYPNTYSGSLRTILSYAANSHYVAYLDDDDWWARDHLSSLLAAVNGREWAFSYRWLVDRDTGWIICRDEWDSVGPGRGINLEKFGGFVSPSNLLISKNCGHFIFPHWSLAGFANGSGEDRLIFAELLKVPSWASTGRHTCFYEISREHLSHPHHARELEARDIRWLNDPALMADVLRLAAEATVALKSGDAAAAKAASEQALALHPCHIPAMHCLARAEWSLGHGAAARDAIDHALELEDGNATIIATWQELHGRATS
ncbi:hypothetical protein GALL_325620 [mine drainage metagenome]|uniref:Glycosyltransferase 2-like domain-containing protein n=1 Tax=mine drainage metagenome TaxID=410659 RepID=A0A1J5R0V3_9ZZZZ